MIDRMKRASVHGESHSGRAPVSAHVHEEPHAGGNLRRRQRDQDRVAAYLRQSFRTVELLRAHAYRLAGSLPPVSGYRAPTYLIGCGRSGTTVLGRMISRHPTVRYLFEPNARWAVVDPRTDFLQLYVPGPARVMMGAELVSASTRARFQATFRPYGRKVLVDKSPTNSLRVDYLEELAPGALYVHILRDGVDVARSISTLAAQTVYYPGGRMLNSWWGINDVKWSLLARDARIAGYDICNLDELESSEQRGAYEWLVTVSEIARAKNHLGHRLCEVRYADLLANPEDVLRRIADHMRLVPDNSWLRDAVSLIRSPPSRSESHSDLMLPRALAERFNALQRSTLLPGRAVPR